MPNELLSICIPTRNRSRYLKEILSAFASQIKEAGFGPDKVAFYISDNAADDETPQILAEFKQKISWANCSRNEINIGADANIIRVTMLAKGKYIWVVGDDELLCNGAVKTVIQLIEKHQPGLIIAYDSRYDSKISAPQVFGDYRMFAMECVRRNTHALAEHTLISSNIFRADCYDENFARENIKTFFAHMFGMIRPLVRQKASVFLPTTPIITIRDWRPGAVDGQLVDVAAAWKVYFTWLQEELQLPELDPSAPSEHARKAMFKAMVKNPFRFFVSNWRSALDPKAYRLFLSRLFSKAD